MTAKLGPRDALQELMVGWLHDQIAKQLTSYVKDKSHYKALVTALVWTTPVMLGGSFSRAYWSWLSHKAFETESKELREYQHPVGRDETSEEFLQHESALQKFLDHLELECLPDALKVMNELLERSGIPATIDTNRDPSGRIKHVWTGGAGELLYDLLITSPLIPPA